MEANPYRKVGRPTWTADMPIEGFDISAETRKLISQRFGSILFHDHLLTVCNEGTLFLRLDIQDFPDHGDAKMLKAFIEPLSKPREQQRTAVLVCSLEERLRHNFLTNVFMSGVKWQER